MKQRFVKALMAGGLLATMIVTGVAATPATANDGSTTGSGSGPTCVVSQAPLNVSGGKQAEFGTSTMVENGTPPAGATVVDCDSVPPPGLDKQSFSAGGGPAGVLTTCKTTGDSQSGDAAPTCNSIYMISNDGTPPAGATQVPCDSIKPPPGAVTMGSGAPDTTSMTCYEVATPSGS